MASFLLKQKLYPTVEKNLAINTNKLRNGIERYLDKHTDQLTKIGPMKMILFTEADKDLVFESIGLTREDITQVVETADDIFKQTSSKPIFIALTMCIKYYKDKRNTKMARSCIIYLTMSMYPQLFYNFWKYNPNEDVMEYTINNLSNKFKIKNEGYLLASITSTAELSDKTYEKRIINFSDEDVVYYINALNTRIRSFLRKIANEYYINKANNNYMGTELDNRDPDNYREADSASFAVDRITNSVTSTLMKGPDAKLINYAAKVCQVSRNELRNYMNSILVPDNIEDIKNVIDAILQLYIYDENQSAQDIKSNSFTVFCLNTYKKSNTSNKNIIRIKDILDKWMEDVEVYKKTQRLATINNFRRAIYTFFVFTIMVYS